MQPAITSCTFRAGPKKADELFAYQKVDWCDFLDLFCDFFQLRALSEVRGVYRKAIFCVFKVATSKNVFRTPKSHQSWMVRHR